MQINVDFSEAMQGLFYTRMERAIPCEISQKYQEASATAIASFHRIKEALPESLQSTLLDMDAALSTEQSEATEAYYKTGFSDGVRFVIQSLVGYK